MTLAGSTQKVELTNDGVGDLDASQLKAHMVKAENTGVGALRVFGRDTIVLTNDGVGSAYYNGSAINTQLNNSGVGSIIKN